MVQIITENMNQFMENFADENLVQTLKNYQILISKEPNNFIMNITISNCCLKIHKLFYKTSSHMTNKFWHNYYTAST